MRHNFIRIFFNVSSTYHRIEKDEKRKEKSVLLGVRSIIASIFVLILGVGGAFLAMWGIKSLSDNLLAIFAMIMGFIFLAGTIMLFIESLMAALYQLKLKRRTIGWVAIGILVACVIGAVVGAVLILSM